jgi:hypothetical protein
MPNEGPPEAAHHNVLARENLRASHEDRDEVVEELRVAGGDGRLDAEQLHQRLQSALTARTYGQLAALVADLSTQPVTPATPAPADRVEQQARPRQRSFWAWLRRR